MANVGIFHTTREPPIVPDGLLAVGVRQGTDLTQRENLSCFVWLRGKGPDAAIEIVSHCKGGERTDKLRTCTRIGVPCCVVFDPHDLLRARVLRMFGLQVGPYCAVAEPYLPEGVGLGVCL
jgi:hypothetical protein